METLTAKSLDLYLDELPSIEEMWAEQLPAEQAPACCASTASTISSTIGSCGGCASTLSTKCP
jgi:hypothetical protein